MARSTRRRPSSSMGPRSAAVQVQPNGSLGPIYQSYNFAATHYLQRIDERYTAGFFGHLKFNDHAEAYTEFMFMDDNTRANYAPAGLFLGAGFATSGTPPLRDGNFYTNCGVGGFGNPGSNPYLTASEFGTLCSPGSAFPRWGADCHSSGAGRYPIADRPSQYRGRTPRRHLCAHHVSRCVRRARGNRAGLELRFVHHLRPDSVQRLPHQ